MKRARPDRGAGTGLPARVYAMVRQVDGLSLAILDGTVTASAYTIGLIVGFEGALPATGRLWMWAAVFLPVVVHLLVNRRVGLYGPVWRYASVEEAARIIAAVGLGALLSAVLLQAIELIVDVNLPVYTAPCVAAMLVLVGSGGLRFQSRLFSLERRARESIERSRTVIVGAGDTGASVALEASRDATAGMLVVGFVDDDPRRQGRSIRGIPVLGTTPQLADLCREHGVDTILIALPTATGAEVRRILSHARAADTRVKMLPTPDEMVDGPLLRSVRDIDVTDLLGREQVQIDVDDVRHYVAGATVLITGAGGSIGSEIARQVATYQPRQLLLLDNDETHLHDLLTSSELDGKGLLADIRDATRIRHIFERYRPDVVFHAAAHKHVPMLEQHPVEAILTNVIGTHNVVSAAASFGCERFVLISTDKAANPCSVMGATKRLAELLVHSVGRAYDRPYAAVRFGNVLNSRGSVVPTFLAQILKGGPVTLTSEEMTRYFMSIPEAVTLVLQAAALSSSGDVLVLEMGEPVKIKDLAHQMIRLAGLRPGIDIRVVVTGPRPGERLHEQLSDDAEVISSTEHRSVLRLLPRVRLSYDEMDDMLGPLRDFSERDVDRAAVSVLEQLLQRAGVGCKLGAEHDDVPISLIDPALELDIAEVAAEQGTARRIT